MSSSIDNYKNRITPAWSRRLQWTGLSVLFLTLLLVATASADLVNRKISGTMPAFGEVSDVEISPDGQTVVYIADQEVDEKFELYSVPLDGSSPPVKLNGPLVSGGSIFFDFKISPDSSRVVFRADYQTNDVVELGSAPIDGSAAPVKLNGPLVSGGDVIGLFQISPDSSRVAYTADQETDEMDELFGVPLDGSGSPVRLNGPLVGGGDVIGIPQFSPDSSRVIYIADQDTDEVFELFVTYDEPPAPPVTPVYLPLVVRP